MTQFEIDLKQDMSINGSGIIQRYIQPNRIQA